MKLLKLRISSDILSKLGHPRIFEYISLIEIHSILQYDPRSLFLQAIVYVNEELSKTRNYNLIQNYETVKFFYVLKETGNKVLCLMQITTESPFWPKLDATPWAAIPPIILDPTSIHFTFIISEKTIKVLDKFLSNFAVSYEVLAIENLNKNIADSSFPIPKFTNKQQEITRYAFRSGYFESPKRIGSEEIANHFNISKSAVTKHLRAVVKKEMKYFFS